MDDVKVTAIRSPNWDDGEARRRLGRVYALILSYRRKDTADTACATKLAVSAADAPASQPASQ